MSTRKPPVRKAASLALRGPESLPRGIRNNNPGNIERTKPRTPWQGAVSIDAAMSRDSRFEVFRDPIWGIRAIVRTLITYQDAHDCDTIAKIVARWAPAHENNVSAYAIQLARAVGIGTGDPIDVTNYRQCSALVRAIVRHENGDGRPYGRKWAEWYPPEFYDEGLRRAGVVPAAPTPLSKSPVVQGAGAAGTAGAAVGVLTVVEAARSTQGLVEPGSATAIVLVAIIVGGAIYAIRARAKRRDTEAG